jgi:hypothetical protein
MPRELELDRLARNTIRTLAIDAIEKARPRCNGGLPNRFRATSRSCRPMSSHRGFGPIRLGLKCRAEMGTDFAYLKTDPTLPIRR